MKPVWLFLALICTTLAFGKPYPEIELTSILSEDQMEAIGVHDMMYTQKEALRLALIEKFLLGIDQGKTRKEEKIKKVEPKPVAPKRPAVIESQIDGEFTGWEGETIFKLFNGQIWKQAEYHYYYHYAFMPKVLIYRSGAGYKMKVNGVEKAIMVEQLR